MTSTGILHATQAASQQERPEREGSLWNPMSLRHSRTSSSRDSSDVKEVARSTPPPKQLQRCGMACSCQRCP